MQTQENLEAFYTLGSQTFTSLILLDPGIHLRLGRAIDEHGVWFDFNYHHKSIDKTALQFRGSIERYLAMSTDLLANVHGLRDFAERGEEFVQNLP
jgi:hypothetical protein